VNMNETERRFLQLFDDLDRDTLDLHAFFELIGNNSPENHQFVLATIENLLAKRWLAEIGGDFYSRTEAGRDELQKEIANA
jgi:hypothetical protein